VQKAIATGRIKLQSDGTIDADRALAALKGATDPAQSRPQAPPARTRPVPPEAIGAVDETLREQGLPSGGPMTFLQARTANEVLKAQERRIRLQKLRGELVDKARAAALVFRLAREFRDAWSQWPPRVAATIAAELGIEPHRMQTVLETHVREQLEQQAEPRIELRSLGVARFDGVCLDHAGQLLIGIGCLEQTGSRALVGHLPSKGARFRRPPTPIGSIHRRNWHEDHARRRRMCRRPLPVNATLVRKVQSNGCGIPAKSAQVIADAAPGRA
jgi:hypothetical protein